MNKNILFHFMYLRVYIYIYNKDIFFKITQLLINDQISKIEFSKGIVIKPPLNNLDDFSENIINRDLLTRAPSKQAFPSSNSLDYHI